MDYSPEHSAPAGDGKSGVGAVKVEEREGGGSAEGKWTKE